MGKLGGEMDSFERHDLGTDYMWGAEKEISAPSGFLE